MCFIDLEPFNALGRVAMLECVSLLLGRVPESSVVDGRDIEVLGDSLDPGW